MAPTKIFYFISTLCGDATTRQLASLLRGLPRSFEPVVCVASPESADDLQGTSGIRVDYRLRRPLVRLSSLTALVGLLREERPAIFHSFGDSANFWGRMAASRSDVPVVVSSFDHRGRQLRYLLTERYLWTRSQAVLVNSRAALRELSTLASVDPLRVRVVHNAVDPEYFHPPAPAVRARARRLAKLSRGQLALLVPSESGWHDHQIGVLAALRQLKRDGRLPDNLQVWFVGMPADGPLSQVVTQAAREVDHPLAGHVRLMDWGDDRRLLYWAADALLQTSLFEGLSDALLEASACSLPGILSAAANADGVVENEVTGFEVATANRSALAQAMARMIELKPPERRALGRRARQRLVERFAPRASHMVDQTLAIYRELLQASGLEIDAGRSVA